MPSHIATVGAILIGANLPSLASESIMILGLDALRFTVKRRVAAHRQSVRAARNWWSKRRANSTRSNERARSNARWITCGAGLSLVRVGAAIDGYVGGSDGAWLSNVALLKAAAQLSGVASQRRRLSVLDPEHLPHGPHHQGLDTLLHDPARLEEVVREDCFPRGNADRFEVDARPCELRLHHLGIAPLAGAVVGPSR